MRGLRLEGRNGTDTVDWLRSVASLVIEEHIGARGGASGELTGGVPPDGRGRLRALWKEMEPCIDRLPNRQRRVVELRFREGMRYADIADRLGIPIGTVRSRLARARVVIDGVVRERQSRSDANPELAADGGLAEGDAGRAGDGNRSPFEAEDGRTQQGSADRTPGDGGLAERTADDSAETGRGSREREMAVRVKGLAGEESAGQNG